MSIGHDVIAQCTAEGWYRFNGSLSTRIPIPNSKKWRIFWPDFFAHFVFIHRQIEWKLTKVWAEIFSFNFICLHLVRTHKTRSASFPSNQFAEPVEQTIFIFEFPLQFTVYRCDYSCFNLFNEYFSSSSSSTVCPFSSVAMIFVRSDCRATWRTFLSPLCSFRSWVQTKANENIKCQNETQSLLPAWKWSEKNCGAKEKNKL